MSRRNRFYPHLLDPDIDLWIRFLDLHESEYIRFDYDVRVGKGRPAEPHHSPEIQKMAIELSQRRIDAIGYQENSLTIIEITCSAGLKCIGQMETYPILYKQTYNPKLEVKTLLLAETLQADIEPILIYRGYDYMVLPKE
jgi:hypothetical protein